MYIRRPSACQLRGHDNPSYSPTVHLVVRIKISAVSIEGLACLYAPVAQLVIVDGDGLIAKAVICECESHGLAP